MAFLDETFKKIILPVWVDRNRVNQITVTAARRWLVEQGIPPSDIDEERLRSLVDAIYIDEFSVKTFCWKVETATGSLLEEHRIKGSAAEIIFDT